MITFHPTLSLWSWLTRLCLPTSVPTQQWLTPLFPGHNITLTDSGRSALAHIIESLNLQNKRIIVPAFLCNNLLPVFEHYGIEPLFIDSNPSTFCPDDTAYDIDADAALLVATFGTLPNQSLVTHLQGKRIRVIEDYAHCSLPTEATTLVADARYYSFAKTMPVPDGGCAIIAPNHTQTESLALPRGTSSVKNILKVWSLFGSLVFTIRTLFRKKPATTPPPWNGRRGISRLSERLCSHAHTARLGPYCHAVRTSSPDTLQKKLLFLGAQSERLWDNPIHAQLPTTQILAKETLCVPLWHCVTPTAVEKYLDTLKDVLPNVPGHTRN